MRAFIVSDVGHIGDLVYIKSGLVVDGLRS